MSRNIEIAPDEFYHLYNRGTDKRDIFSSDADRDRFLLLLYLCNTTDPVHIVDSVKSRGLTSRDLFDIERTDTLVDICAYCLMPNHFHILARENEERNISKFMQKVMTGYTMYFNRVQGRSGALFQGTYKATHIQEDRHLKYLISYIHLNPVKLIDPDWKKNGIRDHIATKKFLDSYHYSSYEDYHADSRAESKILNRAAFPEYFSNVREFEDEVASWLTYKTE